MRSALKSLLTAAMVALVLVAATETSAHCVVGARFFPATLSIDDPCVADELSFPTIASFKNGDDPSTRQLDIAAEVSKRITDKFGLSIGTTWTQLSPSGESRINGFQNLEASLKYQFLTESARELVMSAGLDVEFGHSGSGTVGAESFSVFTPTLFVGQGFGGLPENMRMARPFALTGQIGYSIPSRSSSTSIDPDGGDTTTELNPQFVTYGGSLQYSMPYLKSNVVDLGLPEFLQPSDSDRRISVPDTSRQLSRVRDRDHRTGQPGVIWIGKSFQIGLEAIIPVNRASGTGVGVLAQLHFYLDDLFPRTFGRPIFGNGATSPRSPLGN